MFKITTEPKFTHTVIACVPSDGGHDEQSFKATFRVLDTDKLVDDGTVEGQIEDLRRVVVSLDDLADDQGNPVSYSDALRDQLVRLPYVRIALLNAYIRGIGKAKQGN